MKSHYVFGILFFCFAVASAQDEKAARADVLASQGNYVAEIDLREEILASLQDTLSEEYKEQLYKKKFARSFLVQDLNEAAPLLESAISIFNSMENRPARGTIVLKSEYSSVLLGIGQLEKAWKTANEAYNLAEEKDAGTNAYQKEIAGLLKEFGHIKWFMGDYDASIGYFKQSLEKTIAIYGYFSRQAGDICRFLSEVYSFTPNFRATMEYGSKAQEIYEKIQPENKFILFRQYANNFTNFKEYGDLEKAKSFIEKITAHFEANKNDDGFMYGHYENFPNLNAVTTTYYYKKLEYAAAIEDTVQAEYYYKLFQQTLPESAVDYSPMERNSIVKYDLETGFLFHNMGNYEKAKKYYLNAQKFSGSIDYSFGELQAYWILTTLGADFQNWDDVLFYAETALAYPEIEHFNRRISIQHNLASAYFGKGQYEKALASLTKELDGYIKAPESLNDFVVQQNLIEIGDILLEMYRKEPQVSYLEKAYQAYHHASVVFSRIYRSGEFNDRLASLQNVIYEGMLHCAFLLKDHQGDALSQVEMNDSDHLWSSFLRNQNDFSVDPLHFESKLDSLRTAKEILENQLNRSEEPQTQKVSFQKKLQNIETAIADIHLKMEESQEPYYRFSRTSFRLENIQDGMGEDEMAIKYIVTDSLVFVYGITKDVLRLEQLPVSKDELYKKTDRYLSAIKNIDEDYGEKAKELYAILISPIKPGTYKKITLITDAFLSYLPFETLIGPDEKFVVRKHQVGYAASLKLRDIQNNMQETAQTELGVFSPDYEPQLITSVRDTLFQNLVREGNYELIGARKEAKKINALFDGNLFLSDSATKTNFVNNAAKYDILHLAMHAVLNEKQPNNSNLIFSGNEKLYLSELYNLKVPAKLAVLSACNTGAGSIKNGEGVQSLSRAFTYAGVKSTVRSLWPVPDRETAQIMTGFYQNLKDGQNKAKALRQAKLDYLESTSEKILQHPYYWAGFVVSGDVSPIYSSDSRWWYVMGGVVVLGGIVFFVRKRRKKTDSAA